MTEKELKEEIINQFKKLKVNYDCIFPTNTLKEFYKMLNVEYDEDDFGYANEFWQRVNHLQFELQDKLDKKDYELFCKLGFDSASELVDFLYANKDQIS